MSFNESEFEGLEDSPSSSQQTQRYQREGNENRDGYRNNQNQNNTSYQQQGNGGYQGNSYSNGNNSQGGYYQNRGGNNYQGGGYRNNNGSNGYRNNGGNGNYRNNRNNEPQGDPEFYLPYVGTGNKDTPPDVIAKMKKWAVLLEKHGYTMRSGGMEGAEDAFENAVEVKKEIHLPWRGFNNKESKFTFTTDQARALARQTHESFDTAPPAIQTFLAKNVRMIMGKNLNSPALFVIIWSEDGAERLSEKSPRTGNMGHVVSIASRLRIPVFNFAKPDCEERLTRYFAFKREVTAETATDPHSPNYGKQTNHFDDLS